MPNILFMAPFPNEENIKEGMLQRIKSIDEIFNAEDRLYMDISFTKNIFFKRQKVATGATLFKLNFFIHSLIILYFYVKAEIVYCHSLYNYTKISFFSLFLKKRIILDMHGVIPEEKRAEGYNLISTIYEYAEKAAFRSISLAVHVTKQMKDHYIQKHPSYKGKHVIYSIIPAHLKNLGQNYLAYPDTVEKSDEVVIIYSGNTQIWQNIKLMLNIIKKNDHDKLRYIILTGETEKMSVLIHEVGLSARKIEMRSVAPEQLADYYRKAHYGFILRDDILINRVANPTKLIEYLNYGITPIVKSANIGDFLFFDYEFINCEQSFEHLPALKSKKNIQIAKEIITISNEQDFKSAVLSRTAKE